MKILIVTPAPPHSHYGNRVTALRWTRHLRSLGHRVRIDQQYDTQRCDLLLALHARKSSASVERFRRGNRTAPVILALTGTDLYHDIHTSQAARRSLELASRLVVLQPLGMTELPERLRGKVRVIFQSARKPPGGYAPRKKVFEVCQLAHLRLVKDPFRAAMAARRLPASSRIEVHHLGAAHSTRMENKARAESKSNPRYRWAGSVPRWKALRILARSRILVLTSKLEGGANVVTEAIAASVPIISTRIAGSVGILGKDYPGYFTIGETRALTDLLHRAETDTDFYAALKERCEKLKPLVDPARERKSWQDLLMELN